MEMDIEIQAVAKALHKADGAAAGLPVGGGNAGPAADRGKHRTTAQAPEQDDAFRKQCRRNWARLIKKICEVDPLICPRCQGLMRIISFIEDPPVIKKILLHLHLWEVPKRSPRAKTPPRNFFYDPDFFGGLTS